MEIRIKTTDYQITPDVATYLDERIASIEKHLGGEADHTRCEVEIGLAAGGQKHGANMWFAEISLMHPGNDRILARNNASNVNTAIDDVKNEVLGQLRTYKQTHRRIIRKSGAMIKNMLRFGSGE